MSAVETLVDDELGIIQIVAETPREAGDPAFFHFYAHACNAEPLWGQRNFGRAGGASARRGIALAKAIGEAVERYCSACYDMHDLPLTSFNAAPFPCVPPTDFALYSRQQYGEFGFPYAPFSLDTAIRWTPARDLANGQIRYVPASMVYLPYSQRAQEGEALIAQPISTGLACHSSLAEASVSAICEVIERDAFTIMWQARLSMPHLDQNSLDPSNAELVHKFERTGNSVDLVNITTDVGIPTILAVSHGRHEESPALVVAAATDLSPHHAVRKSLEELAHTWQLAKYLKGSGKGILPAHQFTNIVHQDDHIQLYCHHQQVASADFMVASKTFVRLEDLPHLASGDPSNDLATIVGRVHETGHRVLIADVTTPDIEDVGLAVVRAIVPGFHPLCMGHRFRALGGSRLWTVPQRLGYQGVRPETGDNPFPHPYP
ncbi:hypothetical protein YTPLAS18_05520 [Nitrospira sp.]|nr:hypothetical protein YTPLAS18_05520 [Nitrospira sp.]